MNLTELITQWIGEEKELFAYNKQYIDGYNQALKDLKSKIPDLTKQIDKWHEDKGYSCVAHSEGQDCCLDILLESINKTEKAFSEMTDILRGRNMKIEQEIMEMFDSEFVEGINRNTSEWPDTEKESCTREVKSFISHTITLVRNRERERIVNIIENMGMGNATVQDIKNLIKQKEK